MNLRIETGYEKLDDKQLLQELGRKLAQITYARKVNNTFVVSQREGEKRMIMREAKDRGLLWDAKEKEICG